MSNDQATHVDFTDTTLRFVLADGRELLAPLEWFPKLRDASEQERRHWRLMGHGVGVHWPDIDEDIAVRTLMRSNIGKSSNPGEGLTSWPK